MSSLLELPTPHDQNQSRPVVRDESDELTQLRREVRDLRLRNLQLTSALELRQRLIALHKEYEADIESSLSEIIIAAMEEMAAATPAVPPSPPAPPPASDQAIEAALARERNRISQDIHDTLAQQLTGLVLELEACLRSLPGDATRSEVQLQKAVRTARACLADIRGYMYGLRTPWPSQQGLIPALERLASDFHQRNSVFARLKTDGAVPQLPPEVEQCLLRVAQEALTNIARHAEATHVDIFLGLDNNEVRLTVQDNGVGFDVEPTLRRAQEEGSLGVVGMRERLLSQGGQLEITSTRGAGTKLTARIPLHHHS